MRPLLLLITLLFALSFSLPTGIEFDSNQRFSPTQGPPLSLTEHRIDLLDPNHDEWMDRARILFRVNASQDSDFASVELSTEAGGVFISHWDNFSLNEGESYFATFEIDAWIEGDYHFILRLSHTGGLIEEYDLGVHNLASRLNPPVLELAMMVPQPVLTGEACNISLTFSDEVGVHYGLESEVVLTGAPWLVPPRAERIDCSSWPAGNHTLNLYYRNGLGHTVETSLDIAIHNRPPPTFLFEVEGDGDVIGTPCAVSVEPTHGDIAPHTHEIEWEVEPYRETGENMVLHCADWDAGIHRLRLKVTGPDGISYKKGVNIVRLPPLPNETGNIPDGAKPETWPSRSMADEYPITKEGWLEGGLIVTVIFLATLILLLRLDRGGGGDLSGGLQLGDLEPDSEGLPTHVDAQGWLWRKHPDGRLEWWNRQSGAWAPFAQQSGGITE